MLRFLIRRVAVPVVVVGLFAMAVSEGVPALILGWALIGYLVVRAWPGIRSDLGLLRRAASQGAASGKHGGALGAARARSGDL